MYLNEDNMPSYLILTKEAKEGMQYHAPEKQ